MTEHLLDNPDEQVIQDLCQYLSEAGMMEQTAMLLRQFTERRPDRVWAHVLMGKCLGELGRHREALEAFWNAIDLNGNLIDARFHAGLTAKHLGDSAQALSHFREVILLNSRDARAYNLMGECCAEMGMPGDAELFFAQSRRLAPEFNEPLANLRKLWDGGSFTSIGAGAESSVPDGTGGKGTCPGPDASAVFAGDGEGHALTR